jgi:hypothetical protein
MYVMPRIHYFIFDSENCTKTTNDCPISNAIGLTKFGFSMNNI